MGSHGQTTISFHGAAEEVTGSCFLLESGPHRFLVDCGIFQGGQFNDQKNHEDFAFDPATLDAVFITHAHLDHIGRLPRLVAAGYHGPIYATAATRDLAEIIFEDAAEIMAEDKERYSRDPLYTPEEVPKVINRFVSLEYHQELPLVNNWRAKFWDAGHILGSAVVELSHDQESLVFSGDLGNNPVPILDQTEGPDKATMVVMESTYGDIRHENTENREIMLRAAIIETITSGGVLMIPTFALERTQEILYYLDHLIDEKQIPEIPVYLDSPLAIHATAIFEHHKEAWSDEARREFLRDDFFNFRTLHMTATRDESRTINAIAPPKIIIAGSGMMHGGRILHHAKRYLEDSNSMLLIVGYQAEKSLGRMLLNGAKRVRIHDRQVFVRAKVKAIGAFSAHADQPRLLHWLKGFKKTPQLVALVHGEPDRQRGLEAAIRRELRVEVSRPKRGETITVPL